MNIAWKAGMALSVVALAGCSSSSNNRDNDRFGIFEIGGADAIIAEDASDTLESFLDDGTNEFRTLNASVFRDFNDGDAGTALSDNAIVESISSDGAGGFDVVYIVDGERRELSFAADSYDSDDFAFVTDDRETFLFSYTDSFSGEDRNAASSEFDYFDINGFTAPADASGVRTRTLFVYGAETDRDALPSGSATYTGRIRADAYDEEGDPATSRARVRGALSLTADFDEGEIGGSITNLTADDDSGDLVGERIDIVDGRIDGSGFRAELDGVGNSIEDGGIDELEGLMLGQFYGPGGEEVGGVLTATNPFENGDGSRGRSIIQGAFGATRDGL